MAYPNPSAPLSIFTWNPIPTNVAQVTDTAPPGGITSNSTVTLTGGHNYTGTINISGLDKVTITSDGPVSISPGAALAINAATSTNCIIDGTNGITIRNSSVGGIDANNSTSITINKIAIFNTTGANNIPINISQANKAVITKNWIDGCAFNGISGITTMSNCKVNQNNIFNCTSASAFVGKAIYSDAGDNNQYLANNVTNCSYHGIAVLLNTNSEISYNVLDNCSSGTDADSGAIYMQNLGAAVQKNVVYKNSIISDLIGKGIYLDDQCNTVVVDSNFINNTDQGLFLHRSQNCIITNNTIVNPRTQCVAFQTSISGDTVGNVFKYNLFDMRKWPFSPSVPNSPPSPQVYNMQSTNDFATYATYDFNTYYFDDAGSPGAFCRTFDGTTAVQRNYANWKTLVGSDTNSTLNVDRATPKQVFCGTSMG